jgi:hypothetical protein
MQVRRRPVGRGSDRYASPLYGGTNTSEEHATMGPTTSPNRGALLSALIVGYAAAFLPASALLIVVAQIGANPQLQRLLGPLPGWFSPFVIGLAVARLLALAGLWDLRKWALYPLFLAMAVEAFVGVFVLQSSLAALAFPVRLLVVSGLLVVVAGAFAYAIRRKWAYFR